MQFVTNIEKTLRRKQAQSETELDILRIKYNNLKEVNSKSIAIDLNKSSGLKFLIQGWNRAAASRLDDLDSEVNIGGP